MSGHRPSSSPEGLDMRVLDPIRKNPVAALCVVVAGVGGWIAAGLLGPAGAEAPRAFTPPPGGPPQAIAVADATLGPGEFLPERLGVTRPVPVGLIPKLKPGMTRVEVELVLGPPHSDLLPPVFVSDMGRVTYRTSYALG